MRALLLLAVLLLASGCNRWAILATDGPSKDGAIELVLGERAQAHIYGTKSGFETQPFACDDDDTIVSSDPSILSVRRTGGFQEIDVNSYDVDAPVFDLESHRLGEVELQTECDGEEAKVKVRIVASCCATP